MKIMLVGWTRPQDIATQFGDALEKQGHEVIRISSTLVPPNQSGKFTKHILSDWTITMPAKQKVNTIARVQQCLFRVPLQYYSVKYKPDCMIPITSRMLFDITNVKCPTYYYQTEIQQEVLPYSNGNSNMVGFLYAYPSAYETMKNPFVYEFNHMSIRDFFPYGINPTLFTTDKSFSERSIRIGFMGNTAGQCYQNREQYINLVKSAYGFQQSGFRPFPAYVQFMQDCKIAFNVGCNTGELNIRQFEALAAGCCLLQKNYPQLPELGYHDYENCLLFGTPQELKDKLTWIDDHMADCERIAENGKQLVKLHSWDARATHFLTTIQHTERSVEVSQNIREITCLEQEMEKVWLNAVL